MSGDYSTNWVLKLNADDGHISVSDILNSTDVLWTSVESVLKPQSAAVWPAVVGVAGGGVFVAMAALGFWYLYIRPSKLVCGLMHAILLVASSCESIS